MSAALLLQIITNGIIVKHFPAAFHNTSEWEYEMSPDDKPLSLQAWRDAERKNGHLYTLSKKESECVRIVVKEMTKSASAPMSK